MSSISRKSFFSETFYFLYKRSTGTQPLGKRYTWRKPHEELGLGQHLGTHNREQNDQEQNAHSSRTLRQLFLKFPCSSPITKKKNENENAITSHHVFRFFFRPRSCMPNTRRQARDDTKLEASPSRAVKRSKNEPQRRKQSSSETKRSGVRISNFALPKLHAQRQHNKQFRSCTSR